MTIAFPEGFRWGTATAAYQIEGAAAEAGRGPSIWDTFSRAPGRVYAGHTGDVACDHYHRYPDDVALMRELGIGTYRFSVAWPRVKPDGTGPVNPRGLDFYDRLTDELLGAGIEPMLTLYHWDLPQTLEDRGGWAWRDSAYHFADYAVSVYKRLGDRIRLWTTLNEPWCSAFLGYAVGVHAPGHTDVSRALAAAHHLLLAHGLATAALRASAPSSSLTTSPLTTRATQSLSGRPPHPPSTAPQPFPHPSPSPQPFPHLSPSAQPFPHLSPSPQPFPDLSSTLLPPGPLTLSLTLNLAPVVPADPSDPAELEAANRVDAMLNRLFLEPVLKGGYEPYALEIFEKRAPAGLVRDGDQEIIGQPIDLLGINYYNPCFVMARPGTAENPVYPGSDGVDFRPATGKTTAMGWPIEPRGLTDLLERLHRDYPGTPLIITENGAAFDDVRVDGEVADHDRVAFLESHLRACHDAISRGVDLRGYLVWSLLDNFEWAEGYRKRFGIVHVDYDTQVRTPKESALWYSKVIARNGL